MITMSFETRQPATAQELPAYRPQFGDLIRSILSKGNIGIRAVAAHRFLRQLTHHRRSLLNSLNDNQHPTMWLIPFRDDFRQLIHDDAAPIIARHLRYDSGELRALYIWLLSKFADRCRLLGIDEYANDPSPVVRKHVAKTLRSLEAWRLLDAMVTANPANETIHWFAKAPTRKREFPERLRNYVDYVDQSQSAEAVGPSRMLYWSLYNPWQGRPPKSLSFIRRVLLHIRSLLRGNGHAR